MTIFLHALWGAGGCSSGCIGVSDQPIHDDLNAVDGPMLMIEIDSHGCALSDKEADDMAAEVCKRWNEHATLKAGFEKLFAENAKLTTALSEIDALPVLEINQHNYTHDDVCELNDNAVQAALIARTALDQTSPKSEPINEGAAS